MKKCPPLSRCTMTSCGTTVASSLSATSSVPSPPLDILIFLPPTSDFFTSSANIVSVSIDFYFEVWYDRGWLCSVGCFQRSPSHPILHDKRLIDIRANLRILLVAVHWPFQLLVWQPIYHTVSPSPRIEILEMLHLHSNFIFKFPFVRSGFRYR